MARRYGPITLLAVILLVGGGLLWFHQWPTHSSDNSSEGDVVLRPSTEQGEKIEEGATLPEGKSLFVDPEGRFSFQYEGDKHSYTIEQGSPGIYSFCDGLDCSSVGVEVGRLEIVDGKPFYNYKRLTYDRDVPDTLEEVEWNGYLAYRAAFAWNGWPERHLFIHIPKDGHLFTLYRDVAQYGELYQQFKIMSETFRLME